MDFKMTAPANTSSYSSKEKNANLQLVPQGPQPGIIYGIVNIGTQDGEYQGKATVSNKLKLIVEFPFHKQLYYKEDTVPTPSTLIIDCAFSVSKAKKTGKKTKLLEIIESIFGPLQESQYLSFDFTQLLGLNVFANVVHYTKLDGNIGAKIASFGPFNPQFVDPSQMIRTNDTMLYAIQMGFDNLNFASLPFYLRNAIKESREGKEYASKGGRFTKLDENGQIIIDNGEDNYANANPLGKIVMLTNQFTYEQMKANGWTDDALVENGYARREAPSQAPMPQAPIPAQQMAPQIPAPMSIQPQTPPATAAPSQPMLTMIDKSVSYEQYKSAGWSDQQLIDNGKAMMMPALNDVFPPQPVAGPPSVPAQPMAPTATQQPQTPNVPQAMPSASTMFQNAQPAPVQQMPNVPQANAAPIAPMSPMGSIPPAPFAADEEVDDLPF